MRLMQRRNVDLPQPDGPMKAVVAFWLMSTVIPVSALKSPYQKFRSLTWTFAGPMCTGRLRAKRYRHLVTPSENDAGSSGRTG